MAVDRASGRASQSGTSGWNRIFHPAMSYFRRRRLARFLAAYPGLPEMQVLDIGGTPQIWEILKAEFGTFPKRVVLLNLEPLADVPPGYESVTASALDIPFPDRAFDLSFSNSVIEHVGTPADMAKFASECRRVGRSIYLQTPNRWFPVEPHILTVFLHWLPQKLYRNLSFLSLRRLFYLGDPDGFYRILDTTRLLSAADVARLFPDLAGNLAREKLLGLTKSFVITDRK